MKTSKQSTSSTMQQKNETILPKSTDSGNVILDILAHIVDACYESDGDITKWKPIRDEIEKQKNPL